MDLEGSMTCVCRWTGAVTGVCRDLLGISSVLEDFYIGTHAFFGGVKSGCEGQPRSLQPSMVA